MAGTKVSKRQIIGFIDGIDGPWADVTGAERVAAVASVRDGGAKRSEKVPSNAEATNIVFVRPFDQARDEAVKEALKDQVGAFTTTVSKVYVDRQGNRVGKPETFPDALLIRFKTPDGEAQSGDGAMIECEFALGDWT